MAGRHPAKRRRPRRARACSRRCASPHPRKDRHIRHDICTARKYADRCSYGTREACNRRSESATATRWVYSAAKNGLTNAICSIFAGKCFEQCMLDSRVPWTVHAWFMRTRRVFETICMHECTHTHLLSWLCINTIKCTDTHATAGRQPIDQENNSATPAQKNSRLHSRVEYTNSNHGHSAQTHTHTHIHNTHTHTQHVHRSQPTRAASTPKTRSCLHTSHKRLPRTEEPRIWDNNTHREACHLVRQCQGTLISIMIVFFLA